MNTWQSKSTIYLLVLLLLFSTGCGAATPQPTAVPTATDTPVPTNTPVPTDTPTLTDTATPTSTVTPTRTSTPDRTATAVTRATETAAEAIQNIEEELRRVNISLDPGELTWLSDRKVFLDLTSHSEAQVFPIGQDVWASNFAFGVDIGWDSSGGLAGCGLIFRSQDDLYRGHQYQFLTLRLSGFPGWDIERWQYGTWQSTVTGSVQTSQAINQDPGAVNRYILLARKNEFTVYANGEKMRTSYEGKLSEGRLAFYAFQDSGSTTCTFENAWLWAYSEAQ